MALRVLLADENVTIKKVIQLSLQDYAVSVKSVNLGIDVLDVARQFSPDILFIDVLLQKKDGYSVCQELKADPELSQIPIVLMWSGFIELDEERFKSSGANYKLEKPFDKIALRNIIKSAVTKTQSHDLDSVMQTPTIPSIIINPNTDVTVTNIQQTSTEQASTANRTAKQDDEPTSSWNMDSFSPIPTIDLAKDLTDNPNDPAPTTPIILPTKTQPEATPLMQNLLEDEFVSKPIAPPLQTDNSQSLKTTENNDEWVQSNINQFKVTSDNDTLIDPGNDLLEDTNIDSNLTVSLDATMDEVLNSTEPITDSDFITTNTPPLMPTEKSKTEQQQDPQQIAQQTLAAFPADQLTKIIEQTVQTQCKNSIDSAIWKILPDMAEKIIREEIQKLIKESDQLS